MTSTPFSVGLSEEARVSSRVLRPPGGGHTDIFGSEPEPPRVGRRPGPNTAVVPPPAKKEEEAPQATNGSPEAPLNGSASPQQPPAPKEPREAPEAAPPAPEPAKAEPPKRVRVPPGGFSSGLW